MGADGFYQLPIDADGKCIATNSDALGHTQYVRDRLYPSYRAWQGVASVVNGKKYLAVYNSSTSLIVVIDGLYIATDTGYSVASSYIGWDIYRFDSYTGGVAAQYHYARDSNDSLPANVSALYDLTTISGGVLLHKHREYNPQDTNYSIIAKQMRIRQADNILYTYANAKNIILRQNKGLTMEAQTNLADSIFRNYYIDYHTELIP
jgi:hypothetical protein